MGYNKNKSKKTKDSNKFRSTFETKKIKPIDKKTSARIKTKQNLKNYLGEVDDDLDLLI